MHRASIPSPLGPLAVFASDAGITGVWFEDRVPATLIDTPTPTPTPISASPLLTEACSQLAAYFAGTRTTFALPLAPAGTDFQRSVWGALQTIPFGQTVSYLEIAQKIGNPKAVRAVGLANGANPISIIVPCHRVIGANGTLTGYGGGLERKRQLLVHEGVELL